MTVRPLPALLSRVHMVGIGGAGMSGVARILLDRGALVSGSDAKESRGVLALRARGARIRIGHDGDALDLLPEGPTCVITTHAAIPKTNPELVEAARRAIPVLLRPAVLAELMTGDTALLISGTAGKTTTTSMVVVALQHAGLDPSFAIGGELGAAATNAHHGSGPYFVAEADESDGSLVQYRPDIAVVTNVEADHLDHFGTEAAYVEVFDRFVERVRPGGALVVCTDDRGARELGARAAGRGVQVLRYGSADVATPTPLDATLLEWSQRDTTAAARIQLRGEPEPRTLRLSVPGRHNALNALGALLATVRAGVPTDRVLDGLAGFEGVRRRFELVGSARGVRVFDDYAHHPTKVAAALTAVRDLVGESHGRALVVFQPHLFSRTATFAAHFGAALSLADEVFVLDVYGAREQPLPGISGATVARHVSGPVRYLPDVSRVAGEVAAACSAGDVVVTMGAGDVTMLGEQILTALRESGPAGALGPPR